MTTIEDIRDIFSILHDGTITSSTGDKNLLTLTVHCEYLAQQVDNLFDTFHVELFNIDKIEFAPWTNPIDRQPIIKTDFADIFNAELEILSADIKDNAVVVICKQDDRNFDYCGGNLAICCQAIKVLNQNKHELTIDEFRAIAKNYWTEWSKK